MLFSVFELYKVTYIYIPNRQRAAPNVQTILSQFNYWFVVCRLLRAEVVGATSSDGFLVYVHLYLPNR